jgi:hypothetical protein
MSMTEGLVSITHFCEQHEIDTNVVITLHSSGLIEVESRDDALYIRPQHIPRLERFVRMHLELEINFAGIEAISHLLEKIETQQQEITRLRNLLRIYE